MNRFEINANEWYIDAFAYDVFGDPEQLGWLVGWKKSTSERKHLTLTEMEDLQDLYARDYADEPPSKIHAAAETASLLLTLRMEALIQAASARAREEGGLPEDLPVLAGAHEADPVCCLYGKVRPSITRQGPARPVLSSSPPADGSLGIYKIEGGWDEFHNSLPWDLIDHVNEPDE